ncbi:rhodanese-related sulfurtransferase [bacterium]|nr:rhodanese-related sulfurtransferase [bacterium]
MFTVAALYHFTPLAEPEALRQPLLSLCEAEGVRGTLLLAGEGINGTIAGTPSAIDRVLAHIRALPGCDSLVCKQSRANAMPFTRMKVRVKPEIVTMGVAGVDPLARVGRHVPPHEWNALITAPDVAVIDTRNAYEVSIGSFAGAINPETASFRQFPQWWQDNRARFDGKRIAMFCTGGIRCEKSTNYLLGQGVPEVFHLQGGILKYLEDVPEDQSLWQGECFVFDGRVSVGHGLRQGTAWMCRSCGHPVTEGNTCPDCTPKPSV